MPSCGTVDVTAAGDYLNLVAWTSSGAFDQTNPVSTSKALATWAIPDGRPTDPYRRGSA